ncbi:MAG TPA: hypothetical protein VEU32_10600 [Burkholderiales bacterium]|nr:hypothetical protein [Burkholderiales bacterium]
MDAKREELRIAGAQAIAEALARSAAYEGLRFTVKPFWDKGRDIAGEAKIHTLTAALPEGSASAEIADDLIVGCGADSAAAWVEVYAILNGFLRQLPERKVPATGTTPPQRGGVAGRSRGSMPEAKSTPFEAFLAEDLEDVERELARLALICRIKILEPGAIERVLHEDATVCGAHNPVAFTKLRELLMLYLAMLEKSLDSLGAAETAAIERQVIERLRKSFPDGLGVWPAEELLPGD